MKPRTALLFSALLSALAGAISLAPPAALAANAYPSKPIRLIVPFPPGGPTDIMGRVAAKVIGDKLEQTVVVENKPGAGGNLGTDLVAKAPADGYTIGIGVISSLAISPALGPRQPFDVKTDLTPISLLGIAKGAIVAHPSAPFDDLKSMIAYARDNPGKLSYGSSGIGTANHLAGEYLASVAGIRLTHIPYKGTAQLMQDLLGGQVPVSVESSLTSAVPNVLSGKLKAIAITSATRSPLLPDVPTVAEQGFPGFDVPTWMGVIGPAGVPQQVVAALNRALAEGLEAPDVIDRFAKIGAEPKPTSPEEFAEYIASENARWARVIRDAGIKVE
ncbi:MAG TPA: tripartite tricarboxylate transporter substrate binding protein [Burkholderiaceae bacterium]|nr:tripartite tricarboxylate transporter substrate binding protein [Burkholderiaceae bacterium]